LVAVGARGHQQIVIVAAPPVMQGRAHAEAFRPTQRNGDRGVAFLEQAVAVIGMEARAALPLGRGMGRGRMELQAGVTIGQVQSLDTAKRA
jgi:hypothetical protein